MLKSLALGQSLPSLSSARCSCWLMLFMDGKQFKERTQTYCLPSLVPSYSSPLEVFHQHYTNQLNSINMFQILVAFDESILTYHLSFLGMTLFAWRNNSNLTTNNANNANVGRRDFEAAGALGILCICNGILFIVDFFYVMYQNVLHAPSEY